MALNYGPNLGLPKTQGVTDLIYIKKSYKHYKILHFQVCIFQDQPWNPPDFMDEICWISWWNLLDFMKSARSHGLPLNAVLFSFMRSNTDINVMYKSLAWNLPDFMVYHWMLYFFIHEIQYKYKCNVFHGLSWSTTECCIFGSFGIHTIVQYRYKCNV